MRLITITVNFFYLYVYRFKPAYFPETLETLWNLVYNNVADKYYINVFSKIPFTNNNEIQTETNVLEV